MEHKYNPVRGLGLKLYRVGDTMGKKQEEQQERKHVIFHNDEDLIRCTDCERLMPIKKVVDGLCERCKSKGKSSIDTVMRQFPTGATRDTEEGKLDYEGFLSPYVLERYAMYMNKCRTQADGGLRDSDNWQKGIPKAVYMKSMFRHFMDVWFGHRVVQRRWSVEEGLCALLFNVMGYLHELIKEQKNE